MEKEKQRWEKEKSQLKASIEENKERMLKLESYWIEAQTLCHTVNEHLKEAQAQYQTLEKKYNKAKKLIKDFQQKWVNSGYIVQLGLQAVTKQGFFFWFVSRILGPLNLF